MTVSLYSVLAALVWFSLFILLAAWLQHKTKLHLFCRPAVLLLLGALTVIRALLPIELPVTQEVRLTVAYPFIRDLLRGPWVTAAGTPVSGAAVLLTIWAAGTVVQCVRLYRRIHGDACKIRQLHPEPSRLAEDCLQQLRNQHRSFRRVKLIVSPSIGIPLATGFLNPTLLLPRECGKMSAGELKCILMHELTHLKNRDLWVKLSINLFCCAMWWNPCVYLLKRELDDALEYRCDLTATRSMELKEQLEYLQTLLNSMNQLAEVAPPSALCMSFCGPVQRDISERRFEVVLNREAHQRKRPAVALAAAALALFLASYSFVPQPASFPPQEDLIGEMSITSETAYILASPDSTYYLVFKGEKTEKIPQEILGDSPFCFLTIHDNAKEGLT